MNFDQFCKDFDKRHPRGEVIGRIPFFKAEWNDERKSTNDLLRSFLRSTGTITSTPSMEPYGSCSRGDGDAASMR